MDNIKISNFRKIKETWELDLAPITFFTGTNNSGKSTILKSLLIIEDHLNSENHFELDFNGNNARKHKIDCYNNAVNRVNLIQKNKDLGFKYSNRGYNVMFLFQPSEDKTNGKGKLVKLEVKREDGAKLMIYHTGGFNYQLEFDDVLIERNIEPKDDKNKLQDLALVKTIENLLEDDKKELSKLEINANRLEKEKFKLLKISSENLDDKLKSKEGNSIVVRLSNLVKLLNVSLETVTEYFSLKGLEIENALTLKVDLPTFNSLVQYFTLDTSKNLLNEVLKLELKTLNEGVKNNNQKIISLRQEIADSEKKLKTANKKLKESNLIDKPAIVYKPSFSLEDFHPSERTIDRIIRKILPNYLREYDKSSKLSGIGKAVSRAYRLGDKINSALFFSVDHLSPHRNNQTRLYINNNTSTDINELIKEHSSNPINKKTKAGLFLKKWMNDFNIGDDFRIKSIEGVATKIEIFEEEVWINLVDKGFGAGQIFSILLKIALCINDTKKDSKFRFSYQRKQLIVIEEPEANLHPALQSKLANLFLDAYSKYDIKFIIETHSEYVIRKSQLLNFEEKVFKLFYFENDGPYEMVYNEQGKFDRDFGAGFYDEAGSLTLKMIKELRKNQAK